VCVGYIIVLKLKIKKRKSGDEGYEDAAKYRYIKK
jgi:hypothetical protein